MEFETLKSAIESILFVSGEPVAMDRIAKLTKAKLPEIENAVMDLQGQYGKRGIVIIKKDSSVQMATSPENSQIISALLKCEIQESLSRAALEVLSIVAYRGPITRVEIEAIRGVNCSFTLRTLLMRGLLERVENSKDNRAYIYKISFDFLKKMGIQGTSQLPDWEALSKDPRINSVIQ